MVNVGDFEYMEYCSKCGVIFNVRKIKCVKYKDRNPVYTCPVCKSKLVYDNDRLKTVSVWTLGGLKDEI